MPAVLSSIRLESQQLRSGRQQMLTNGSQRFVSMCMYSNGVTWSGGDYCNVTDSVMPFKYNVNSATGENVN